jgi:hypothetical protein
MVTYECSMGAGIAQILATVGLSLSVIQLPCYLEYHLSLNLLAGAS